MCENKVCTRCEKKKPLDDFHNNKSSKDGKKSACKVCRTGDTKEYQKKNKEKRYEYSREYYQNNKEYVKGKVNEYREENSEKIKLSKKKYREENSEKIKLSKKKHREENPEKVSESNKLWRIRNSDYIKKFLKNKRLEDPLFRLMCNTRGCIKKSYNNKGWDKTSKSQEILGCDFKTFEKHLNDNLYGFTIDDSGLDLDHIIPLSTATTEEELLALNHYTNFQLLPSTYNRYVKSDKPWDKEHFENWLSENYSC